MAKGAGAIRAATRFPLDNCEKFAHSEPNKARHASKCMRTMAGYFVFGTPFATVIR